MRKLTLLVFPAVVFASICDSVNRETLEKLAPIKGLPYKIVSKQEVEGLCEVVIELNNQLIPLYTNGKVLISGEAWKDKKPITQEHLKRIRTQIRNERLKILEKYVVAVYKPKGSKEDKCVYFVADPECPYCNWVKGRVKALADKYGVCLKLVFLPLPFHRGAKEKAVNFVCSKKNFQDYVSNNYGNKTCGRGQQLFKNVLKDLSFLSATPTFLYPKGDSFEVITGTNLQALERLFKKIKGY